jgi:hypothetical protein
MGIPEDRACCKNLSAQGADLVGAKGNSVIAWQVSGDCKLGNAIAWQVGGDCELGNTLGQLPPGTDARLLEALCYLRLYV